MYYRDKQNLLSNDFSFLPSCFWLFQFCFCVFQYFSWMFRYFFWLFQPYFVMDGASPGCGVLPEGAKLPCP